MERKKFNGTDASSGVCEKVQKLSINEDLSSKF
jgi:hypothetical protein